MPLATLASEVNVPDVTSDVNIVKKILQGTATDLMPANPTNKQDCDTSVI